MGINLGGCIMGVTTIGHIGALIWGLIFAESDSTPWEGLNEYEGYEANDSVLISFGGPIKLLGGCVNEVMPQANLFELQNGSPDHLVDALKASNEARSAMVIFTPDTAKIWKEQYGFNSVQAASGLPVRQYYSNPWCVEITILFLYDQADSKTKSKGTRKWI